MTLPAGRIARLRRELRLLRDAPAGRRFQRRHDRMLARKEPAWKHRARLAGSALVVVAGVVMLAFPGPGLLVIILGLAMLGGEFAWVAERMDQTELLLRRWWASARHAWSRAGWIARTVIVLGATIAVGGLGVAVWRIVFA